MTRAGQSFAWKIALLGLAVCAIATTARLAGARATPAATATRGVAAPAFSFEADAAPLSGVQTGSCGTKRAKSPARTLCKKLKRGVLPESGQAPVIFVESTRLPLARLNIAEPGTRFLFVPSGTPPDLSSRAPPAV
jgi:hypothetical protein